MLGDNYTEDKKLCRVAYSNKKIGPRAIQAHPDSAEDVRRLYAALHGQTIQVGADHVAIEVSNDLVCLQASSGEDPRVR